MGATGGRVDDDVIDDLNKLLRGELSALETYRQGLDKIRDEHGHDARFMQLAQIQQDHEQAASELRALAQRMGGRASNDSGPWGSWSNTVMGAARLLGDKAALSALASGERSGLDDYQDIMKKDHTPDELKHVYRSLLTRNQQHIDQLDRMIETV